MGVKNGRREWTGRMDGGERERKEGKSSSLPLLHKTDRPTWRTASSNGP